ncbi:MFS transporter [Propionibacteriaceae bacterium Y1923]
MSPATEPVESFGALVRQLGLPVYLPTLSQASGFTALAPVLPLVALDLGFGIAAAAALGLIAGVLGVLGPVPAGRVIAWLGERVAMVITGVLVTCALLCGWLIVGDGEANGAGSAHRYGLVAVLVGVGVGQQVWILGRQSYVGSAVHPRLRARAMSSFGGMMRIGQVIGPALGAVAAAASGMAAVFLLSAGLMTLATLLVTVFLVPRAQAGPTPDEAAGGTGDQPGAAAGFDGAWWRDPRVVTMAKVAMGTAPLQMARVVRPTLLPLVGAGLGLGAETISLVFAVAASVEILLFLPAGSYMDKFGRTAVLVPCLLMLGVGYVALAVLALTVGESSPTMALVTVGGVALLLALGNGLGAGIVMTLGLDLTPEQDRARHLARWMTMTGVGPLAGPLLVSLVSLVAPIALAGGLLGSLCLAAGVWILRILPGVTPNPPAGPLHRPEQQQQH